MGWPKGRPRKVERAAFTLREPEPWTYFGDRCPRCNIPIGPNGIYSGIETKLPVSHRPLMICRVCGAMIAAKRTPKEAET